MPHENLQDQLYDIYGVWYVPFWQRPWFYWSMLSVGFVGISILVWMFIKKYYGQKSVEQIPYWQQALDQLHLLRQHNVATAEHGQKFYLTLTIILKNYMQERYAYDVRSKTDAEVLAYLKEMNFDKTLYNELEQVFQGSVFIKFANTQAMQSQIEQDLLRSQAFIHNTLPQVENSHSNKV